MSERKTKVVAYRLPHAQADLLERASARKGIAPAEFTRRAVVRQLQRIALARATEAGRFAPDDLAEGDAEPDREMR